MALGPSFSSKVPTQTPMILVPSVFTSFNHNFALISVKFWAIEISIFLEIITTYLFDTKIIY
jgi:hypothetical protein